MRPTPDAPTDQVLVTPRVRVGRVSGSRDALEEQAFAELDEGEVGDDHADEGHEEQRGERVEAQHVGKR